MSPKLKPLLLPQLVEDRKTVDDTHHTSFEGELPYTSCTTNSSSSDIVSPVTPTFSTRGHFRGSSSTSSLDLSCTQVQDSPCSPTQPLTKKTSKRQLPDVQEEPVEREEEKTAALGHFDLYSCLCDAPCEHRKNLDQSVPAEFIADCDFEYDLGCLSDGSYSPETGSSNQHDSLDSPFLGMTSRLGSRFNTINRWKPRRTNLMSSPTTEVSFENVLSRGTSSRSSSVSSPNHQLSERFHDLAALATRPTHYESVDETGSFCDADDELEKERRATLERDRTKATTPLLPPLMTAPLAQPPIESPLQSPTIAPPSAASEVQKTPVAPPNYSRPSLSTKPSAASLHVPNSMELPLPLPAILQEHDEWSDRLGHANFTITPRPYELEKVDSDTINQFRDDWEAARVNYTKHLVRTGENYGETSKIYSLTEAKWAETENRWKAIYEDAIKRAMPRSLRNHNRSYTVSSRSRSRGRGRGRSGSASAATMGRPANGDLFAEMQWQRIEDNLPSAVPRMLDADGKFPSRGDEDIVGPMHRAETMERSQSEDKHGAKFWKNLAEKVGLRR